MIKQIFIFLSFFLVISVAYAKPPLKPLAEQRNSFKTKLIEKKKAGALLPVPPNNAPLKIISYPTPIGNMAGLMSTVEDENKKYPAIIWITGGFPQGGASDFIWQNNSYKNDQSANIFWRKGIVTLYPTLRGNEGNPGFVENFYGEAEDVVSALRYLKTLKHVDPDQIYLGGHSTGATLALLSAELTDEFSAVFAFGPVSNPDYYGKEVPYEGDIKTESELRAPINFLDTISSHTYIIEGQYGNVKSLEEMRKASKNSQLYFWTIDGADHFEALSPVTNVIADAIIKKHSASKKTLSLSLKEVQSGYDQVQENMRRANVLSRLSEASAYGIDIAMSQSVEHVFWSDEKDRLQKVADNLKTHNFSAGPVTLRKTKNDESYYSLAIGINQKLNDLLLLFKQQKIIDDVAKKHEVNYDNWYWEAAQ